MLKDARRKRDDSVHPFGTLLEGKLILKEPDALVLPERARRLRRAIARRIPRVRLEDLLSQVDSWTDFAEVFRPYPGLEVPPSPAPPKRALLAALVAEGTNLGAEVLCAQTQGLSRDEIAALSGAFIRQDTLEAAGAVLVEYVRGRCRASLWSEKARLTWSGSRTQTSGKPTPVTFYPWYFAHYDRPADTYRSVADESAAYGVRVISGPAHEALAVLDGLLGNDTTPAMSVGAEPREYEDQLFAICDLLGYAYMPRLSDLSNQRLYKADLGETYSDIEPLFHGAADLGRVREEWDFMARVVASLRDRVSPARILVPRLVQAADARGVSAAFAELGRVVKSMYVLRYINDPALRRRIHLHADRRAQQRKLARRIFFSGRGDFRKDHAGLVMDAPSALAVLGNAVLVWSVVKIAEAVDGLRDEGEAVLDEDLALLPPILSAHVIVKGPYSFTPAP